MEDIKDIKPIVFEELKKYIAEDPLRLDVPGHKGNYFDNEFVDYFGKNIIKADVNSMQRLDNLNYSKSIIKQSQLNLAKLHGAKDSRFLVNGTTLGIQTMILASVKEGEKILIPKNIHKSVQSALVLSGAIPIYVDVKFDDNLGIYTILKLDEIKKVLNKHKDIKAALLINPSYYGLKYKFKEIVSFLKKQEIIVLVDEAHGGHLYLQDEQTSAMDAGADISCVSYHKTLGSLTQTSLLLFNSDLVSIENVDYVFTMLTTTSPSYLFICNLEVTIIDLFKNKKSKFEKTQNKLNDFKHKLNQIKGISILDENYLKVDEVDFDHLRLVINVSQLKLSGFEVYDMLRDKYNIQTELGEFNIVLCIITIFDDFDKLNRLYEALVEIASDNLGQKKKKRIPHVLKYEQKILYSPRMSFYMPSKLVNYKETLGEVIGESLMLYPPGIPLIMQGEVITQELIDYIEYLLDENEQVYGINDEKICILERFN